MCFTARGNRSLAILHEVADLHGVRRSVNAYRRGDLPAATFTNLDEPEADSPDEPPAEAVRLWLTQQIADTITRYQHSPAFTAIELRTIRALWLDGLSLRQLARIEGVTAEAVRARLEGNKYGQGGVRQKAPEFYRWWAFKNRWRRGGLRVARAHHRQRAQSQVEAA